MKKVVLAIAILVSSIFADTIYLKDGREVNDATIIEIGVSEVKYKIGERAVLYTAYKSDIAIIFYKDGTKEVFSNEPASTSNSTSNSGTKDTYVNFTSGQRWGTWGLNSVVPGLGSLVIMKDWAGAITQWALSGAGFIVLGIGLSELESDSYSSSYNSYSYYDYDDHDDDEAEILLVSGIVVLSANFIFNIVRSASYDRPKNAAYKPYEGFNFAIKPSKHGSYMPYLTYSKAF